ncbi:MAG: DUF1015 family protein [Gammaproteobacteria bacterium]|jgi:uncharacterized protein (DUF1015 family)|nr:DUF1015 family protein [Gammaproteobacteria bacterium]
MSLIKPFRGLRPVPGRSDDVVAPPYDVVDRAEAKALVKNRPWSFLHISRPEIDLPDTTDPYDPAVYAKGRENLDRMVAEGILVREDRPCYYAYRLTMGEHIQTGIVATASVEAYDRNRIKKHEFTRPVKEDDRVRQIDTLNAQTGPVFLVYAADPVVDGILREVSSVPADVDVTAGRDGVRHEIWKIERFETVEALTAAFDAMPAIYVADGHHRSAAGSRVGNARREANPAHTGEESYNYFLTVIFPHDQMQILDYNRVVRDLNGLSKDGFLAAVGTAFDLELSDRPVKPASSGEFGMYLDGQWYRLRIHEERIPEEDPVARLDVSLLQNNLIEPVLGIEDPRRDDRIDFVGGIRGLEGLEKRVDSGDWELAFALFPTTMKALMDVADAGEVMPPKSTWFEPKLADGLISHVLD